MVQHSVAMRERATLHILTTASRASKLDCQVQNGSVPRTTEYQASELVQIQKLERSSEALHADFEAAAGGPEPNVVSFEQQRAECERFASGPVSREAKPVTSTSTL